MGAIARQGWHSRNAVKTFLVRFTLLFSSLTAALAVGEFALRAIEARRESHYVYPFGMHQHSRQYGWIPVPSGSFRHAEREFDVTYRTDAAGLRKTSPDGGTGQVLGIYGDSFAWGSGVEDGDTFASYLSGNLRDSRVRNAGVVSYSFDQYYLRFKSDFENPGRRPWIAVFAIYPANDLIDINRPYVSAYGFLRPGEKRLALKTKPLLVPKEGEFQFIYPEVSQIDESHSAGAGARVHELLRRSQSLKLLNEIGGLNALLPFLPKRLQDNLFGMAVNDLREGISRFSWCLDRISETSVSAVFLLIPSKKLAERRRGLGTGEEAHYKAIKGLLEERRLPFVDLMQEFAWDGRYYLPYNGHFNKKGNQRVARAVYEKLVRLGWARG